MSRIELIATAAFGLEAVVKRELEALGYEILRAEDAKLTFAGDEAAVAKTNLWLRSADRVLIKLGELQVKTFDALFEGVKALPWEEWIPADGRFTISATSVKSVLRSVPDCQSITEKAVVERLKKAYHKEWFEKSGADFGIKVTILKDRATITMDTSGTGLHKRGYRVRDVQAPIKETLAAGLVQLSFWRDSRLLVDPFCGSGTIAIEAAMIGRRMAPGLSRKFAAEGWERIGQRVWKEERKSAFEAIRHDTQLRIMACDISQSAIEAARQNALEAGVDDCIKFKRMPFKQFTSQENHGIIISNPPYGERIGDQKELARLYMDLNDFFQTQPAWSLFLITADKDFERKFLRKTADRKRKLYNGRLETTYFQYHGEKGESKCQQQPQYPIK